MSVDCRQVREVFKMSAHGQVSWDGGLHAHSSRCGFQLCRYFAMDWCLPSMIVDDGQRNGQNPPFSLSIRILKKVFVSFMKAGCANGGMQIGRANLETCRFLCKSTLLRANCAFALKGSSMCCDRRSSAYISIGSVWRFRS